jgi:hypothetical protein
MKEKIQISVVSAIAGAIVLAIVGFSWGGWVTGGTAQDMADEKAENAVIDRLVPICVSQYSKDPEKDVKLKELKDTNGWQKGEFVEKQGWATLPGEENPNRKVAEECANRIMALGQ